MRSDIFHIKVSATLLLVLWVTQLSAQNTNDSLLAKDNVMIPLPTISINFGFNHAMTDVKLQHGPSPVRQFGYQLTVSQRVTNFLNASIALYTGTIYGEEQRNLTNLNYRTTLFSQQLNVEYNFYPLLKPDGNGRQLFRPYLGFGVGAIYFRSKGDLKASDGQQYQYWTDGGIYAEVEGSVDQSEATPIERDNTYETELRDANLDGLRKYSQVAFSLPINAGIRFQISKNVGVNAGFTYALNFSDLLDNVSESGTGDRAGKSGNDNHLFASVGLSIFLGRTKHSSTPKSPAFELAIEVNSESTDDSKQVVSEVTDRSIEDSADEPKTERDTAKNDASENVPEASSQLRSELLAIDQQNPQLSAQKLALAVFSSKNAELTELDASLSSWIQNRTTSESKSQLKTAKTELSTMLEDLSTLSSELLKAVEKLNSAAVERAKTDDPLINVEGTFSLEQESLRAKLDEIENMMETLRATDDPADLMNIAQWTQNSTLEISQALKDKTTLVERDVDRSSLGVLETKKSLLETYLKSENVTPQDSSSAVSLLANVNEELKRVEVKTGMSDKSMTNFEVSTLTAKTAPEETTALDNGSAQNETNQNNTKADASAIDSNANVALNSKNGTPRSIAEIENAPAKETGGFHWADLDTNGWISPDEVLHFIDLLFEGESIRTVADIQNLIDYYFDQE